MLIAEAFVIDIFPECCIRYQLLAISSMGEWSLCLWFPLSLFCSASSLYLFVNVSLISPFLFISHIVFGQNHPQHPDAKREEWQSLHSSWRPYLSHWHCTGMHCERDDWNTKHNIHLLTGVKRLCMFTPKKQSCYIRLKAFAKAGDGTQLLFKSNTCLQSPAAAHTGLRLFITDILMKDSQHERIRNRDHF